MTGIPGGRSTVREEAMYNTTPMRIPDGLLDDFPDALRPDLQSIVDSARLKFRTRWHLVSDDPVGAINYMLEEMEPVFSRAVKSAEEAGSTLRNVERFIDKLAEANPGRDSAATEELKRKAKESTAWCKLDMAMQVAATRNQGQSQTGGGDV